MGSGAPLEKVYIFGRLALPQYNRALYQVGFELELINKYLRRLIVQQNQRTKEKLIKSSLGSIPVCEVSVHTNMSSITCFPELHVV